VPLLRAILCCLGLITAIVACGGQQAREAAYLASGRKYLAERNYVKARLEFRNALQLDPNDADASFLGGEAAEAVGDVREAAQMFQAAIDSNDHHLGARARLARLYAENGAPDKAIELVTPGLAIAPHDPDLLTSRAIARQLSGDTVGARRDAQEAMRLNPTSETTEILLAQLYNDDGEPQEAMDLLTKAAAAPQASTSIHRALAQLYLAAGRYADAAHELELNVAAEPSNTAHRFRLAELLLADGNIDGAEGALQAAVGHAPNDTEPKLVLANFLARYRGFDVAASYIRKITAADPKDFQLQLGCAEFYVHHERLPEAEAIYRRVIEDAGSDANGYAARDELATLYVSSDRAAEAEPLLAEVLQNSPHDGDALVARARIEIARKKFDAAVADLRDAQRDHPNSPPVERLLAQAYEAGNDATLAEDTLRAAVRANPAAADVTFDLVHFLQRHGEADQTKAIVERLAARLDRMIATDPNNAVLRNEEGNALAMLRRDDAAIASYREAIRLSPSWPEPYRGLAAMQAAVDGQHGEGTASKMR
jgi:tetratricopeptide (TPR) repeat protein